MKMATTGTVATTGASTLHVGIKISEIREFFDIVKKCFLILAMCTQRGVNYRSFSELAEEGSHQIITLCLYGHRLDLLLCRSVRCSFKVK